MTSDALMVVETLFTIIWQYFTSWYIPGTNVTPAMAGFGILFFTVFLRILGKFLFGIWVHSDGFGINGDKEGD